MEIMNVALDKQTKQWLETIMKAQRLTLQWYWLLFIFTVSFATIVSAVFQVLSYFRG